MGEKHEMAEACCQDAASCCQESTGNSQAVDLLVEENAVDLSVKIVKQFRVELDKILQGMKYFQAGPNTPGECRRQLAISITDLEGTILRLGMCLKDLKTPNPYPNSYKPENTIVDPTADGLKL